jgi:hypothetical protein
MRSCGKAPGGCSPRRCRPRWTAIAAFAAERDGDGRRLVVRNGYHQPRDVLTSADAVEVIVPRVNDKRTDPVTGERNRFSSAISLPWARRTPSVRPRTGDERYEAIADRRCLVTRVLGAPSLCWSMKR